MVDPTAPTGATTPNTATRDAATPAPAPTGTAAQATPPTGTPALSTVDHQALLHAYYTMGQRSVGMPAMGAVPPPAPAAGFSYYNPFPVTPVAPPYPLFASPTLQPPPNPLPRPRALHTDTIALTTPPKRARSTDVEPRQRHPGTTPVPPSAIDHTIPFTEAFKMPMRYHSQSFTDGESLTQFLQLPNVTALTSPTNDYPQLALRLSLNILGASTDQMNRVIATSPEFKLYHTETTHRVSQPSFTHNTPPGFACTQINIPLRDVLYPNNCHIEHNGRYLHPITVLGKETDAFHYPLIAELAADNHPSDKRNNNWRSVLVVFYHRDHIMVPFDDRHRDMRKRDATKEITDPPRWFRLGTLAYNVANIHPPHFKQRFADHLGDKLIPVPGSSDPYGGTRRKKFTLLSVHVVHPTEPPAPPPAPPTAGPPAPGPAGPPPQPQPPATAEFTQTDQQALDTLLDQLTPDSTLTHDQLTALRGLLAKHKHTVPGTQPAPAPGASHPAPAAAP